MYLELVQNRWQSILQSSLINVHSVPTENDSGLWLPGDTGKTFLNGRRLFGPRGKKTYLTGIGNVSQSKSYLGIVTSWFSGDVMITTEYLRDKTTISSPV